MLWKVASGLDVPFSALLGDVETYPIQRQSVETTAKTAVVAEVERRLRERYDDVQDLDGVRVETDDGWFLVRASGTEPLVRVTSEARDEDDAERLPLVRITVEGRSAAQTEALYSQAVELVDDAMAGVEG